MHFFFQFSSLNSKITITVWVLLWWDGLTDIIKLVGVFLIMFWNTPETWEENYVTKLVHFGPEIIVLN
jgi:hypothetical protein